MMAALASGALFGLGLTVSQMTNPAKVLGFLDIAGDWDPSLALVMLGALAVAAPAYWLARHLNQPLCADSFARPVEAEVDNRLIIGALLFGVGWGLVGYCPGPALASLGFASGRTLLFVASMLIGMAAFAAVSPDSFPSVLRHNTRH
jgi:uncharacterized membrane protein YedE/YeeE